MIYRWIGKSFVKYGILFVRHRFARQIRIGAGVAAVAAGIAIYLATRNVPEG